MQDWKNFLHRAQHGDLSAFKGYYGAAGRRANRYQPFLY